MANAELALRGVVVEDDPRDKEIETLRLKMRQAERDRADAERAAERAREDAHRALSMLRKQLGPLYRALQAVFGELDAAGVTEGPPDHVAPIGASAPSNKWDAWKTRLGPGCGKVIDVLLLGGEMTVTAIAVAAHMGKRQVYAATATLGQAGLLVRNGGRFALKEL